METAQQLPAMNPNGPACPVVTARRVGVFGAAALALALLAGPARAATPVVEIIAFAHPPVQSALKPLRDLLARPGAGVKVVEIDMESPQAESRLQAIGLKGHIPIVILIDGQYRHQRADGSTVAFTGFPASAGAKSGWTTADVEAVMTVQKARKP
jgi:hypothetical protein